jgi:DNA-binding response OmpR family regulator
MESRIPALWTLAVHCRVGDQVHRLTHKECAVPCLLAERAGNAVTRDEILDRAWSPDEFPTQRTVDNFIVRLRRSWWNATLPIPKHPQCSRRGFQLEAGHE